MKLTDDAVIAPFPMLSTFWFVAPAGADRENEKHGLVSLIMPATLMMAVPSPPIARINEVGSDAVAACSSGAVSSSGVR